MQYLDQAMTVINAQPFSTQERSLIASAASALPWEALAPMIEQLQDPQQAEKGKDAAYALIGDLDQQHHGLAGMCVFAAAMYHTARRLHAQGVEKEVLNHTFSCLHQMSMRYQQEHGCLGFDRGFWIWRQSSGIIFRLGSLEYEYLPALSQHAADITGLTAGEPVLSIHIPTGTDLTREALQASYAQASAFYRSHPAVCLADGKLPQGIICHSWLLSKALYALLGESSRIRGFADDFRICLSEETGEAWRHFLFLAGPETAIKDFSEHTSLQRTVKAYLLSGGGIGEGWGLLKRGF